jgi:diguanylate cyclase (GGDEF)-like protein
VAEAPLGRDHPVPVTVSIGVAAFPLAGVDRESLVRAADAALYQAKALGKNRTIVFQPSEEGKAS